MAGLESYQRGLPEFAWSIWDAWRNIEFERMGECLSCESCSTWRCALAETFKSCSQTQEQHPSWRPYTDLWVKLTLDRPACGGAAFFLGVPIPALWRQLKSFFLNTIMERWQPSANSAVIFLVIDLLQNEANPAGTNGR